MNKKVMVVMLVVFTLSAMPLSGQDIMDRTRDIGITAAYWLSGDISVEGGTTEKDGSFLLRTFADFYLMPKLAMGVYFNFAPYSQNDIDVTLYEFGGSIKPKFMLDKDLALKPGLNIGYRLSSSDLELFEIDALGLNLSVELQKQMDNMLIHGEFGFLAQPAGGNEWADVTFAPIIYFGGGITF
ncbi:MAG: hypothetical protein JXR46_14005 [Calditrichaceae bacterium]|nr:hypothetical protein [Calditrichaceae bacterium]MBN2710151.1 hypothetical protein [Calditrichaceae bacterium]RQV95804.1 MAG: hypothetical protein EH224_06420 [Calditrichota bacterium]